MKKKIAKIILIVTIFFTACQDTSNKQEKLPVSATPQATEESISEEQSTIPQTEADTIPQTETEPAATIGQIETTTAEPQTSADNYVTFLFAGDICLEEDGYVIDHYDEMGEDLTKCVSPYLLQRMAEADLFMLNHEYTISTRGSRLDKYYTFRANPSRMNILEQMSVDIVSLANNHIYDYGHDAFVDTMNLLQERGIKYVGAGSNLAEAAKVEYFEIKGIKIGVVSASRAEKYVITPQATEDREGVFWMYDHTKLKQVISDADSQCDYLIAYLHWGTEDSKYMEQYQQNIARELVDCGVDAIIGGHPHIVQGMEYIGNVPVLYSLGDFWFNKEDKYSMMASFKIYQDGSSEVEIIPCRQKNYTIQYLETEEAQRAFFDYFNSISADKVLG